MPTNDKKTSPLDFVYMARRQRDGKIKIGISQNVAARLVMLSKKYASEMVLLGVQRGSYDLETVLLTKFQQYALPAKKRGRLSEWFHPVPELFDYLEQNMHKPGESIHLVAPQSRQPNPRKRKIGTASTDALLKHRLFELTAKKTISDNRRITQQDISTETGIAPFTIARLMNNDSIERINSDDVKRLCRYFNCDVSDFLYIEYPVTSEGFAS